MSLRAKLFFWIGSLFLIAAIISYLLPRLFIQEDVEDLNSAFTEQVSKQRLNEIEIKKRLFTERVQEHLASLNGSLLYVYENNDVEKKFSSTDSPKSIWEQAGTLISYNPNIGFLQVSNSKDFDIGIVTDNLKYYVAEGITLEENVTFVHLRREGVQGREESDGPYVGIRLPESEKGPIRSIYYLYEPSTLFTLKDIDYSLLIPFLEGVSLDNLANPQKAWETFNQLKEKANALQKILEEQKITSLGKLNDWIKKGRPDSLKHVSQKTNPLFSSTQETKHPTNARNIAREYISLILNTIEESPFENGVPLGAVSFFKVDHSRKIPYYFGGGILNKDLFFNTPLFNADAYYNTYPPQNSNSMIANGFALLANPELMQFFIANTLNLTNEKEPVYLTLGDNLFPLVMDSFALNNELIIFVNNQGEVLKAFDGNGNLLPLNFFSTFPIKDIFNKTDGAFVVEDSSYHFFQLDETKDLPLHILAFLPDDKEPTYKLKTIISDKIIKIYTSLSFQLLIISIGILGVALIILGLISKKITKPITLLAKASEEVANGNYSNISLPNVPQTIDEKDEVNILTRSFCNMIRGLKDKERIRGALDKVVSKEVASEILKGNVHLGGESRVVTVLFSDIRGFTHRTEHLDPQVVIINLNRYMTLMSQVIEFEGGVIDKYVGDEIMALFGAPIHIQDGPLKAIKTAVLMLEKLKVLNVEKVKEGHPPFEIGIGIHTGNVVAGNMGAENRLNYTVLGANVNLASRLCAAAAPMEIRVTKETLEASGAKHLFIIEELPAQIYKGFSEPIVTYSIKGFK